MRVLWGEMWRGRARGRFCSGPPHRSVAWAQSGKTRLGSAGTGAPRRNAPRLHASIILGLISRTLSGPPVSSSTPSMAHPLRKGFIAATQTCSCIHCLASENLMVELEPVRAGGLLNTELLFLALPMPKEKVRYFPWFCAKPWRRRQLLGGKEAGARGGLGTSSSRKTGVTVIIIPVMSSINHDEDGQSSRASTLPTATPPPPRVHATTKQSLPEAARPPLSPLRLCLRRRNLEKGARKGGERTPGEGSGRFNAGKRMWLYP